MKSTESTTVEPLCQMKIAKLASTTPASRCIFCAPAVSLRRWYPCGRFGLSPGWFTARSFWGTSHAAGALETASKRCCARGILRSLHALTKGGPDQSPLVLTGQSWRNAASSAEKARLSAATSVTRTTSHRGGSSRICRESARWSTAESAGSGCVRGASGRTRS